MDKIKMFGWKQEDAVGKFRILGVSDLTVDHSYQRDRLSEMNVLTIARDFSWAAFGSIVVAEREDGSLVIIDGQHRVDAARRRGIKFVPAMVYQVARRDVEANAFLSANTARKAVDALTKFRAGLLAGLPLHVEISQWAQDNGFTIGCSSDSQNRISFVAHLLRRWANNPVCAQNALLACREIVDPGEHIGHSLFLGLWWCAAYCDIDPMESGLKIKKMGGQVAVLQAIKRHQIEAGNTSKTEKTCGMGVLYIVNYGRRTRIIPTQKEA